MIRLIEALGYRCLKDVRQGLGPFHVLVGPNASGKSTFLDVPKLLGDLVTYGVKAVADRSPDMRNLVFLGRDRKFEVAVEFEIPGTRKVRLSNGYENVRYEVALGLDEAGELTIIAETVWLKPDRVVPSRQRDLFPESGEAREHLVLPEGKNKPVGWKKVVTRKGPNVYFCLLYTSDAADE